MENVDLKSLPIPPYAVYNIGNQNPESLLDFVDILQLELIAAKVLPADYDFEARSSHAARRRAGDLFRYQSAGAGLWLQARHSPAGRTAAFRQMVSGVLPYPVNLSVAG